MGKLGNVILRVSLVALLLFAMGTCLAVRASADDIASSFLTGTNPSGNWTYGGLTAIGGVGLFTPFAFSCTNCYPTLPASSGQGYLVWGPAPPATGPLPIAFENNTAANETLGTVNLPLGWLNLHPSQNSFADARFTATTAGTYVINGIFQGDDIFGTTTDVHILSGTTDLFDAEVTGTGGPSQQAFNLTHTFAVGDTIDFAVGLGTDGSFFNDSTGLQGTFSLATVPTPEPSSLIMFSTGVLGLAAAAMRRKFFH